MIPFFLKELLDHYYTNRDYNLPQQPLHINPDEERKLVDYLMAYRKSAWKQVFEAYTYGLEIHAQNVLTYYYANPGDNLRLVYETWPILIDNIRKFNWQGAGMFRKWVRGFVRNKTLKFIDKEYGYTRRTVQINEDFIDFGHSVEYLENQSRLREKLDEKRKGYFMSEKDWQILEACLMFDMSMKEYCATQDNQSVVAGYKHLQRAVKKFRTVYGTDFKVFLDLE